MKKRWKILIGFVVVIVGYVAWVSRPEFGDHAELTDTCAFPTITNAQYRALVAEAKALIEPKRREIANSAGNLEQNTRNPPLGDLAREFGKKSQSSEETFVRLFAFGRALDGRVRNVAPVRDTYPGPGVRWVDRDSADRKLSTPRLSLSAGFQGPPGLFRWNLETWVWARLLGRRYEPFGAGFSFEVPEGTPPEEALAGRQIVAAGAGKGLFVWPLNDIRWGDVRLENRCPDAVRFLNRLDDLLKRGKN